MNKRISSNSLFRKIPFLHLSMLAAAFVMGGVILQILGFAPIKTYSILFSGTFSSFNSAAEVLVKTTPLILTGLSFAYAAKAGLVNIGAEGQLYAGGITATLAAANFPELPVFIHLPMALAAGFTGGALWGFLAGWLKVKFRANEIITTVMLNYIAILLVSSCVTGPMKNPQGLMPESAPVAATAMLKRILPGTRLHPGFFLALCALFIFHILIWRTKTGFEIRITGANRHAALAAGISTTRPALLAMVLAGGMAGLAGCIEILAVQGRLIQMFSPGYGYDGIAVALAGMNTPTGIGLAALLFGILRTGGNKMQLLGQVPVSVIDILKGLIVIAVILGAAVRKIRKNSGETQ